MADKTISALTSATTPLAGTEVLPIVQSSTTVKVAVNNLTVQNIRANATTGILQVTGPAAASTRVVTVPDANFTAARTDAAQSFTGDQTLSTGNLVIGTSGKGIDFSITSHPAGMTSELLADYEEGTFTPVLRFGIGTTGITYNKQFGRYTKIGRLVTAVIYMQLTSKGSSTGSADFIGLPFNPAPAGGGQNQSAFVGYYILTGLTGVPMVRVDSGSPGGAFSQTGAATPSNLTDANFTNSSIIVMTTTYDV
jgi:hypothetical protein